MGEKAKYLCHVGDMKLIIALGMHDKTDLDKCYRIFYPSKSQWLLYVTPPLNSKLLHYAHIVFHMVLTINSECFSKQH
jgi:hypothetical protein